MALSRKAQEVNIRRHRYDSSGGGGGGQRGGQPPTEVPVDTPAVPPLHAPRWNQPICINLSTHLYRRCGWS